MLNMLHDFIQNEERDAVAAGFKLRQANEESTDICHYPANPASPEGSKRALFIDLVDECLA
eukprot:5327077-Amphidinium_carterae.1